VIRAVRKVLCLDWDPRALRLVVARVGRGQMRLEDAHSHRIPSDVDPGNPESMGEFIRQTLRRHHWRFHRVIVDIPRDRAVINRLTLPPTPAHELAAAVRFQAMRELPFPLDEAVVDYVIMKRDEQGLATEVLLAAVTQETLANVQAICTAAGLVPSRIGLRPYANLVSIRHLPHLADRRVLFVDVGPTMTEIDVMDAGQLAFARSASVAVPEPAQAPEGEGGEVPPVPEAAVAAAINELVLEITRTLQAYRAGEPGAAIDRVVVAGGAGVEERLADAVRPRFGLETELFDPTGALGVSPADAIKLRSFAAALGTAWGISREGLLELDFLNPKRPIPRSEVLKRRVRKVAVAVAAVLTVAIGTNESLYWHRHGELTAWRQQVERRKQDLKRYLEIENLVDEVRDWEYHSVWPEDLLRLTGAAVGPGKDMLVQQMSFDARKATITMKKVLASHQDVLLRYVGLLNEQTEDGQRLYRASLGGWSPLGGRESKFQGSADVSVELLKLAKHLNERDERIKARKKRSRGL